MGNYEFVDLGELIENLDSIYAHTDDKKPSETLEEHLMETKKFLLMLFEKKGIGKIIDNIINRLTCSGKLLSKECYSLVKKIFVNAVFLHDMGKINPAFQKIKMNNALYKDISFNDSEHSLLSALIYIDVFTPSIKEITDRNLRYYMYNILYSFAYNISRHHSYLKDTLDFTDKLQQKQDLKYYKDYKSPTLMDIKLGENCPFITIQRLNSWKNWKMDGIEFYILNRLLFALIVGCDFYATHSFKTGNEIDFGLLEDIDRILNIYKNYDVYKGIECYKKDKNYFSKTPINSLRSDLFLEAEETLLKNLDHNVFYLEAPTGGGKTNVAINLALNIVKHLPQYNKVFYIFPFNTLVEQTKKTFEKIFKDKLNYAVINSITPIITKEEKQMSEGDKNIDYNMSYLDRQFLHYPVILTTHVNLFTYLFGTGREACFPLIHLCNSVVVLDEIQSYKNSIWTEIIMYLSKYSELLNIKIIIMSATLPKLHLLLNNINMNTHIVNLIRDRDKYYQNPLFKNRVKLDFSMLERKIDYDKLEKKLWEVLSKRKKPTKVLIEFIKKDSAREFYNIIKDKYPKVIELSGDDNKHYREKAIKEIEESKDIIVVATQVIEAGVDIDMDIGFKDISIFDSEEQFLGRINRSCTKDDSYAYFFHIDKTENIYRGDFRTGTDLRDKDYQDMLVNKDFDAFYSCCLKRIEDFKEELNKNNISIFIEKAMKLNFKEVQKDMQLIHQKNFQLYIPYILKTEKEEIDGFELWEQYKELCNDNRIAYTKKQIDLSILREKMLYFTFTLTTYDIDINEPPIYKEECGGYFYIVNQGFVTEEGKFDRKKYQEMAGRMFL